MSSNRDQSKRGVLFVVAFAAVAVVVALVLLARRGPEVPRQGSERYERVSRAFGRGLAALDVGLLDDARREFTRTTELVSAEPAGWANLGLTLIRLGELDAAAPPIERARELAPAAAEVLLLAGRMEIARGRIDAGIARLREAVGRDPQGLRTRFALAAEVERSGTPTAARDVQAIFDDLVAMAPGNQALLVERARSAAAAGDQARVRDSMTRLQSFAAVWPAVAREQLAEVNAGLAAQAMPRVLRALTLLRNVLTRVPAYTRALGELRTPPELIAEPFATFLKMMPPTAMPSPPDSALTFAAVAGSEAAADAAILIPAVTDTRRVDVVPGAVLAVDWNHDFIADVVRRRGDGFVLAQRDASGGETDVTAMLAPLLPCPCAGIWAADVEMDGDIDLVVAPASAPVVVLRNNGDGSWQPTTSLAAAGTVRAFVWADLDGDADPDAGFIDAGGRLRVLINDQAGQFHLETPGGDAGQPLRGLTVADVDADGRIDVVAVGASGVVVRVSRGGAGWTSATLASWDGFPPGTAVGAARVHAADVDNNGALDLIVATPAQSRIWLADVDLRFAPLAVGIDGAVHGVADLDDDGRLDLLTIAGGRVRRLAGHGARAYHWKAIRARAQQNAGDQRINSFGIGGEVEIRAGLLVQKQVLTGLPLHFGLGDRTGIDVARILWPNGVPQAEFDAAVDDAIVAEQRLKGSCPWVFAYDGERMQFVTDFLWRSPLGLRINAQDTAGVTQTEDWVRLRGDQLAARDGAYDVRITAELWETHFFDHVSLMAVDHPADVEVFVDERFSPTQPPARTVRAFQMRGPVGEARDDRGTEVTAIVAARDDRHLATFARGDYQGIAGDHFVEFSIDPALAAAGGVLVAQGWVYPTDSSINVAIGQRREGPPRGVALEARAVDGTWTVIDPDLGFPAGKNKTMLIDLTGVGGATRLRLRTQLEVYWDALLQAVPAEADLQTQTLALDAAELRYRGFSHTESLRGDRPETPDYTQLDSLSPRWRDLEGYHTRFGDVRELLVGVDDRYVIMNAGDEMRLRFGAPAAPAAGWRRDFVLVGDGWEKDGDYNTGYSQTVLPLPTHTRSTYMAAPGALTLENDPVYRRHRADWERFHTRYVRPDRFLQGLRGR